MPLLNPPGGGSAYAGNPSPAPAGAQPNPPTGPFAPAPTNVPSAQGGGWAANVGSSIIGPLTSGWYVIVASVTAILASNTRAAPIIAGILGVSLIFQLNLLIQKQ